MIRKALLFSFSANYTILVLGFIGTLFISRLLTPAQIGVFSVAAVLVGMAHLVRDFGVGQYLIREKDLTREKMQAAFALTLMIGVTMAVLLALASGPIARFYGDLGVRQVILVLAGNFLLIPFGSVTMAMLRRQMNFGALYLINVSSAVAHLLTAVSLALLGHGFMSLAWAALAGVITTVLMAGIHRPSELPWLPSLKGIGKVVSFGSYVSGANVAGEVGSAAPNLIIGKALGMEAVGIFGKAVGLIDIFNRLVMYAIWPVVLPHFSAHMHAGRDLKIGYMKAMSYLTALSWPFFVFVGLMAYPLVRVLYGTQWDASVPLVGILSVAAGIGSTFLLCEQVFIALGEVKKQVQMTLITITIKVTMLLLAAPFGIKAISIALVLSTLPNSYIIVRYLKGLVGLGFADIIKATRKSMLVTLITAPVPVAAVLLLPIGPEHVVAPLLIAAAGTAAAWLAGLFLSDHEMKDDVANHLAKARKFVLSKLYSR